MIIIFGRGWVEGVLRIRGFLQSLTPRKYGGNTVCQFFHGEKHHYLTLCVNNVLVQSQHEKRLFSKLESTDSRWSCERSNSSPRSKIVCFLGIVGDISGVKGLKKTSLFKCFFSFSWETLLPSQQLNYI